MEHGSGAAGVPNSMWVVMCYSLQSMSVTEKSVICMSEHIGVEKQLQFLGVFMPFLPPPKKVRLQGKSCSWKMK